MILHPPPCGRGNLDRIVLGMATTTELTTRLEAINVILQTGVQSNSVDGESTSFNHDTLRRERTEIRQQLGMEKKRSRVFNLNMNGR